jgi:hypothetical protein
LNARTRKPRSDKGRILPTERDYEILRWIGEQYLVRFDHLRWLLGKDRGCPVSQRTAQGIVERWKKLKFVVQKKYLFREPAYVWLTTPGLRFAGLPYSYWEPKIATVAHPHDVNRVRIYLEDNLRYQILTWRSERDIFWYEANREHIPDSEVDIIERASGQRMVVAIEVERTQKSAERIDAILRSLAEHYSTIWYFTADGAWTGIERGIARLPEAYSRKFRMKSLDVL